MIASLTAETRHAILAHLTRFVTAYAPHTEPWGVERIHEWLGWFLDRGLLFTIWHPDGYVIAMTCIRLVRDPLEATICQNAYLLDVLAENVFVDFAACHPKCKNWAMKRLWTYVHRVVTTNSPQVTHVNWVRHTSTKSLFRYRVERMHNRLGDDFYGNT